MSHKLTLSVAVTLTVVIATMSPVMASSGGSLPWEGPLEQIQESITGPVAGYIALAAVAIAGGMLIFGGELNDFARRLIYVVLVAGILLGATTDRRPVRSDWCLDRTSVFEPDAKLATTEEGRTHA
jgi:type IV secretory pathway VirB2 component (pilin)